MCQRPEDHTPLLRHCRVFCNDPGVLTEYLGMVINFARGSVRVSVDEGWEKSSVGDVERL